VKLSVKDKTIIIVGDTFEVITRKKGSKSLATIVGIHDNRKGSVTRHQTRECPNDQLSR
jgi:hypothetical protein